jgi:hypothetical protein
LRVSSSKIGAPSSLKHLDPPLARRIRSPSKAIEGFSDIVPEKRVRDAWYTDEGPSQGASHKLRIIIICVLVSRNWRRRWIPLLLGNLYEVPIGS